MSFVHLHVHSHFSLLEGLPKIDELVRAAKKMNMKALALTDFGSLYGAIEFYKAARRSGIKPIIGMEAYISVGENTYHLILLAENEIGYKNLLKLSSLGHLENFGTNSAGELVPRLTKEWLKTYHEGLIALSGCLEGEIAQLIYKQENYAKAKETALNYAQIFGPDYFYLELQDHPDLPGQIEVNNGLIKMSEETGLPMVATRDVHYLSFDDREAQDILTCIKSGRTINEPGRPSLVSVNRSLNSQEDIGSRFRHVASALENTVKIAERCNLELKLGKWHFPPVEIPEGKTANQILEENARAGLKELFKEITPAIEERMNYELGVITKKGYAPYFLAVADYVKWSRAHDIVITTRGSAAGSLVSYLLGIIDVNPLYFLLPFERFLNPHRPSPPDIDVDFADNRRDDVIAYVTQKYGADKVAQIITFGTMMARAAARDTGRALGYSYSFCDQVAKMIPFGSQGFPMTIEKALAITPELFALYNSNAEVKRLLDLAQKIEGCARHTSVHAAGVVISPTPLTDFTAVQRETGGDKIVTQYEMHSVEEAGLLKMDFLGIRNLSILGEAVKIVEKIHGIKVKLHDIPWDDKQTYEMLARGETGGLFQLGGSGMTRYLEDLKPSNIFDIMAMVALFRPGPMESIPEFIRRKHNPKLISYLDPRMKDYLQNSYGVIAYQDDVLLTAINIAGYTWEEADKLRKAMGKKIPEEMAAQKEKFISGCIANGLKSKKANELWELIEPFAAYGFNKCVSGDTKILIDGGAWLSVDKIYQQHLGVKVAGIKGKKVDYFSVKRIVSHSRQKTFALKLRSGRKLTATGNHPLLKLTGWTDISSLKIGDRVATARCLPSGFRNWSEKKLKVLGYLISEGNLCHPHGIYFYSANEEEIKDFCRAAHYFKVNLKLNRSKSAVSVYIGCVDQRKGNPLREWLGELGLLGHSATRKFFPTEVFLLSLKSLAILLGKLWQGDGCVSLSEKGQIFYATSSEELANQLQHLLLRFGIISTIHTKKFKYRGDYKVGFTINVSGYNNLEKFAASIGKHLIGSKKKNLRQLLKVHPILNGSLNSLCARGTADTLPCEVLDIVRSEIKDKSLPLQEAVQKCGVSERLFFQDKNKRGLRRETVRQIADGLKSTKLKKIIDAPFFWDEIIKIEETVERDVFDLNIPETGNFLANDIVTHNSHAASYAVIAYQTAYLKAHFPEEYMAAVLSAESADIEKVSENVAECRKMSIEVLPPDVNESFALFSVVPRKNKEDKPKIRFGLEAIKNVGQHIAERVIEERKAKGPYLDLEDFLGRVQDKDLNKKSMESLIKTGALDRFGERGQLLANTILLTGFAQDSRRDLESNQSSLFELGANPSSGRLHLKPAPLAGREEKLTWEKELLGLYISEHPFAEMTKKLGRDILPIKKIMETESKDPWFLFCGQIVSAKRIVTKKGDFMLFVGLEDMTAKVEVIVFPRVYQKFKDVLLADSKVCIIGKISNREEDREKKIIAETVEILTESSIAGIKERYKMMLQSGADFAPEVAPMEKTPEVLISVSRALDKITVEELKKIWSAYPGEVPVFVLAGQNEIKKKIATGVKVAINDGLKQEIEKLIGPGSVSFT